MVSEIKNLKEYLKKSDKTISKNEIEVMSPAITAMKVLQDKMAGEADHVGIKNEQDVVDLVKSVRDEE